MSERSWVLKAGFWQGAILKGLPWGQEVSQPELRARTVWDRCGECKPVQFSGCGRYVKETYGKQGWR